MQKKLFILTFFFFQLFLFYANGQIHRATSQSQYHIKYDTNFTVQYFLNKLLIYSPELTLTTTSSNINGNDALIVWAASIIGTFFVGICGVLPVIILPRLSEDGHKLSGSLLGDVFIHLLPETYTSISNSLNHINDENEKKRFYINNGLWTIFGILIFFCIEKLFPDENEQEHEEKIDKKQTEYYKKHDKQTKETKKTSVFIKPFWIHSIKTIGVLNLIANSIDNFTHGIAVSGGFQASIKFGMMSLIATLLHEIPHEIGDFAILLKSGLDYKQAALAQLATSCSGILGAVFALSSYSSAEKAGNATAWILPFTSGGFLYIALANILPELSSETDLKQSMRQCFFILMGILLIYIFSFIL